MSDKRDNNIKINEETKINKCKQCINYQEKDDMCLLKGLKKCSKKAEFSKCNYYLIHDKFIMF